MLITIEIDNAHTPILSQVLHLVALLGSPAMESITIHPFQVLSHAESLSPTESYVVRTKDIAGIDWNTAVSAEFLRTARRGELEAAAAKHLHEFNRLRQQHGITAPLQLAKIGENKSI